MTPITECNKIHRFLTDIKCLDKLIKAHGFAPWFNISLVAGDAIQQLYKWLSLLNECHVACVVAINQSIIYWIIFIYLLPCPLLLIVLLKEHLQ